MTKELEALKIGIPKLKKLYENCAKKMSSNDILGFDLTFSYLDKELQRLEAIDNANTTEALECLEEIGKTLMFTDYETLESKTLSEVMPNYYRKCKQALIKSQEQEKVLEIVKKKTVSIFQLSCCKNVYEYNDLKFNDNEKLTEEEFDLLKRYCNEEKD